jgi:cellulose synthase/poly-beta-1,6-N-acetylglucosamine synthase-like glycosyltransferase
MSNTLAIGAMVIAVLYSAALLALAVYGLHSLGLLWLFLRRRSAMSELELRENNIALSLAELPNVVVQIPIYNERDVAEDVIRACAALDYPSSKFQLQVLDDSDDDTQQRIARAVAAAKACGIDAVHLTRPQRIGYKAGALAHGLTHNQAPFVAIFDADFQPHPDFLRRAIIPLLNDERLALVQGRWDHANRSANALTAAQALGIDSHFAIEQGARAWNNLTLNFNGTCGVWRRAAIDDAGGWQHDTLTEDMDLSYRAQLRGWRCTYRSSLAVPGELPATIGAWRSQQFRWAKGSLQTLVKLGGPVWRSSWSWPRRIAAIMHLSHYLIHPLIFLSVLCAPLAMLAVPFLPTAMIAVMVTCFALGAGAPLILYSASQLALHGWPGLRNLRDLPMLTAMGTGIALSNSIAAWQVLRGIATPFVRTPKKGQSSGSYRSSDANGWPELLLAGWSASGLIAGFSWSHVWMAPLLWLYTGGFAWIGWRTLRERGLTAKDFSLPLIGLTSVVLYGYLASLSQSWRELPLTFASVGVVLGGLYLAAVAVVRSHATNNGKYPSLFFILFIALIMRVLCLGLTPSDDLARYAIEGQQILNGENPYSVAPTASTITATLPPHITAPLNHGDWTAIYPPIALIYHTLISSISLEPLTFQIAALFMEACTWWLIILLLRQYGLPTSLVLLAAWNPIGPLFITGEGHHDVLMAIFIVASFLQAKRANIIFLSCAALIKPFAAVALLPVLLRQRWWWWLLPPAIALVAYLPFSSPGLGVMNSLGRFGTQMHFHGAIDPLVSEVWSWMVPQTMVRGCTVLTLGLTLISGCIIVLRSHRGAPTPAIYARLFTVLLLCLPTLHPWYLVLVVIMLPFTTSWGLIVWTALAPIYWLHGIAMLPTGAWYESVWVTSLAHVPAIALMAWEVTGRPFIGQRAKAKSSWEMSS